MLLTILTINSQIWGEKQIIYIFFQIKDMLNFKKNNVQTQSNEIKGHSTK